MRGREVAAGEADWDGKGARTGSAGLLEVLVNAAPCFSLEQAAEIARRHFGISAKISALASERDQNFLLDGVGDKWILKIANSAEAPNVGELQAAALRHLARHAPQVPVPRVIAACDGASVVTVAAANSLHQVRVQTYLRGTVARTVGDVAGRAATMGRCLASLDVGLRGFFHPAAGRELAWDLKQLPRLRPLLKHTEDPTRRRAAEQALDRIEPLLRSVLPRLRAQVIHNDLNPSNILFQSAESLEISGIIDFGDLVHSALIADVAVGAAYQPLHTDDALLNVAEFIGGYEQLNPLMDEEREVLPDLIMARLICIVTLTQWRAVRHSANREYILRNSERAWALLEHLLLLSPQEASERLLACKSGARDLNARAHTASTTSAISEPSALVERASLTQRRARLLGPAYRLFYDEPLHIVRGEGAYLFDSDGRRYLDLYNNVAHVGHCHPKIVAALVNQSAMLNTHTRYLHETVLNYAARLTARCPVSLSQVMFTCTGSEANELALRIARAATGARGVIVSAYAYHGNTAALAELSASYYPSAEGIGPTVRTIAAPDTYYAGRAHAVRETDFLASIDAAIESLKRAGIQLAAFLIDPHFTSDGILAPPPPYLAAAVARIRQAGGLFISDEVQVGFGRLGSHFWGFDAHGVVPDILTMGKPMANGHPVGGIVTRPDLLSTFARTTRYFNTFGGNPVSCAAALAVLEVLEEEGLEQNAMEVGAYLKERLRQLAIRRPLIGDIRGSGLFLGVELVRDRQRREAATGETLRVVNGLKSRGILTSHVGPRANVLKIRPPMVLAKQQVDDFIIAFDEVLGEQ